MSESSDLKARDAERRETERRATLEPPGGQVDLSSAARTRRILVFFLGLSWALAPLVTALTVDPATEAYPPMVVAPLVVLAGHIALTVWKHDVFQKTAIKRGVVATIGIGLIGQVSLAVTAPVIGLDGVQARVCTLLLWAIVAGVASATIDGRLWLGALVFLGAFFGCAFLATTVAQVLYVTSASYFVAAVNAFVILRPRLEARAAAMTDLRRGSMTE